MLLLDFGAQVDGYCADLTRTVVVGARADRAATSGLRTVATAQRRALKGIRAGMTGREADAWPAKSSSRQASERRSGIRWGTASGWRCTRRPGWRRRDETALPAGAVVTVEPGIYLPGWGGVRLEDDVTW